MHTGMKRTRGAVVAEDDVGGVGLFAGGEAGQIYQISPDGKVVEEIANTGGFILGVAISPDGSWLAMVLRQFRGPMVLD